MARSRFRIRVVQYSGQVITEDLPHSGCKYSAWIDQQGVSVAAAQIGRATITLFPPGSSDGMAAQAVYTQLGINNRVEIYPATGPGVAVPLWTGIIDRLPMSRSQYSIEAADSIQVAQNSHRFIPFTTSETADVIIKKYGIRYYKPVVADSLATLAATGTTWTFPSFTAGTWKPATFEGKPGVGASFTSASGYSFLLFPTPYTQDLTDSIVICDGALSLSGSGAGGVHVVIGATDGSGNPGAHTGLSLDCAYQVSPPQIDTGVSNSDALLPAFLSPEMALPAASGTFRFQMVAVLRGVDNGGYVPYEFLLNGQQIGVVSPGGTDPNAGNRLTPNHLANPGYIGVGAHNGTGPTTGTFWLGNLTVLAAAPLFQTGTIGTPQVVTTPPTHQFNNATCLEIMKAAAAQEGWTIYKTPGVGWGNDTISVH